MAVVMDVRTCLANDEISDAVLLRDQAGFHADEYVFFWDQFNSKERSAMTKESERMKAAAVTAPKISEAQHKRLEARIKESGISRDDVKAEILKRFGKEHITDLTSDEYDVIDGLLSPAQQDTSPSAAPVSDDASPPVVAGPSDDDLIAEIATWCKRHKFDMARDMCRAIKDEAKRTQTAAKIDKAEAFVKIGRAHV